MRGARFSICQPVSQKVFCGEDFSPKGAKTQSAAAFKSFLCAFAPLREKYLFPLRALDPFESFLCKASASNSYRSDGSLCGFEAEPLKCFGGVSVHRHYIDVVERDIIKLIREGFDPFRIVVSDRYAFRQVKHSIHSIL